MAFHKKFPKTLPGSNYPEWIEIELTEEVEKEVEEKARKENIQLMKNCLVDAKGILQEKGLRAYDNNRVRVAVALFEKLASHSVYHKEERAKEIFDEEYGEK